MNNTRCCLLRLPAHLPEPWRRRPWRPNGSVLIGTTSHRPSASPRQPSGARSRTGSQRSDLADGVLPRRRLGHPILLGSTGCSPIRLTSVADLLVVEDDETIGTALVAGLH